jgi:hypothetical protein
MDYDPMVMDDAESLGPVVKISQVRLVATIAASPLLFGWRDRVSNAA